MRMLFASAPMFAAMTSLGLAGPVTPADTGSAAPAELTNAPAAQVAPLERTGRAELTDAQMDKVSAGNIPSFAAITAVNHSHHAACHAPTLTSFILC
jgi:hypothetical protein